jgi:phosphatidylserine/phosphatidylglycerophosphate/cardiolipin synthase-like enzyme
MNAVSLASVGDLSEHIRNACSVELDVYVLRNPLLLYSLEAASERGASVSVRLGSPGDAPERAANAAAMRALSAAGARVTAEAGFGPSALHAKVAIVDDTVYLDDRNFTGEESETIVACRPPNRDYERTKSAALADEAKMLRADSGHDVILSTEALGPGPVVDALIERARRGDRVRVMYNPEARDRASLQAVAHLRAAGVQLRASPENHKIAVSGDTAWIGSANASPGAPEQREWGMTVPEAVTSRLRATLEYCWWTAKTPSNAAHPSLYRNPGA